MAVQVSVPCTPPLPSSPIHSPSSHPLPYPPLPPTPLPSPPIHPPNIEENFSWLHFFCCVDILQAF